MHHLFLSLTISLYLRDRRTDRQTPLCVWLAWCREHSAVMASELLQPRDLACGTLFQSSCVILTSPTDCSDDSWRDIFFVKHEHCALWLLICGAIEKHLQGYTVRVRWLTETAYSCTKSFVALTGTVCMLCWALSRVYETVRCPPLCLSVCLSVPADFGTRYRLIAARCTAVWRARASSECGQCHIVSLLRQLNMVLFIVILWMLNMFYAERWTASNSCWQQAWLRHGMTDCC